METLEGLKRRIASTEDLQSVVKTMKSLAAVKIRQYQNAVEAVEAYNKTVEMGLQAVLYGWPDTGRGGTAAESDKRLGAVVFGSDQGMCGQLNDQVASYAAEAMEKRNVRPDHRNILSVGQRMTARLESQGQLLEESFSLPNSVHGITDKVGELLLRIESWTDVRGLDRIFLFYSRPTSGASFKPHSVRLLPVDQHWLAEIKKNQWPTAMLPLYTMERGQLFSKLIRQYLFVSLFRAFADSAASENASRLASMQRAEGNIKEQLEELNKRYHMQRQMSITEELLDIVSGFEALTNVS